jgi:hypothetical protein
MIVLLKDVILKRIKKNNDKGKFIYYDKKNIARKGKIIFC